MHIKRGRMEAGERTLTQNGLQSELSLTIREILLS